MTDVYATGVVAFVVGFVVGWRLAVRIRGSTSIELTVRRRFGDDLEEPD